MRAETVAFERAAAVARAARGWRSAGFIDDATLRGFEAEFPDPRVRPSWVWRVLTFVLATVLLLGIFLAVALGGVRDGTSFGMLCLFVGGICVAAAEIQETSPSMALRGGAGASAFWSGVLLITGTSLLVERFFGLHGDTWVEITLAISAVVWGVAAVRFGNAVLAIFSAASFFLFLARLPSGRLLCAAVGLTLAILAHSHLDDGSWPPPHRTSAAVVLVVALTALYAALNYWSVETQWIERLHRMDGWASMPQALLVASAVTTTLLPLAVLVRGIRSRRTILIDAGLVFAALSLITLRRYVHIAPLWAILVAAGAALLGVAIWLSRWLSRGADGERGGFTAEPLFSDEAKARLLTVIPVAAALSPPAPVPQEQGFTPGGGSFGGGGASEKF